MLEHDALKHYWTITGHQLKLCPTLFEGHYYLFFRHEGDILFHVTSLITVCHITKPEQFAELTQSKLRMAFPKHHRVMSRGCNLSFRAITELEFFDIVK